MTKTGTGLSDNQRSVLAFIAVALITLSTYVAALPDEDGIPRWLIIILGAGAALAAVGERFLGVRDATTAAVAKDVKPNLHQERKPSSSQL